MDIEEKQLGGDAYIVLLTILAY